MQREKIYVSVQINLCYQKKTSCFCSRRQSLKSKLHTFVGECNLRETRTGGPEIEARMTGENSKQSPTKLAIVSEDNAVDCSIAGDVFREVVQKHSVLEESSGEEGKGSYSAVSSCLS